MKKLIAILLMTSLALISVFAGGSQEQSGVKTEMSARDVIRRIAISFFIFIPF